MRNPEANELSPTTRIAAAPAAAPPSCVRSSTASSRTPATFVGQCVAFGGCCVAPNDPTRRCDVCGHEWGRVEGDTPTFRPYQLLSAVRPDEDNVRREDARTGERSWMFPEGLPIGPLFSSRPRAGRLAAAGRLISYKSDSSTHANLGAPQSRGEPRGQGGHVQLGVGGRLRRGRE